MNLAIFDKTHKWLMLSKCINKMIINWTFFSKDQRHGIDEVEFFNCTDNDDRTPLLIASQFGRSAIVTRLLKNKAVNTGAKDKYGKTALYLAAENNHLKVLEVCFYHNNPFLRYQSGPRFFSSSNRYKMGRGGPSHFIPYKI